MECPACHTENAEDSRFCSRCGTQLGLDGAGPSFATRTLATPLPAICGDHLVAGKYRIVEEVGYLDFFLAVSALLLRRMSAAWARL